MEITKTTSVKLSEDEIKEIVAEYISKKINKPIKSKNAIFYIGKKFDNDIDDRFGIDYIKCCEVAYSEK